MVVGATIKNVSCPNGNFSSETVNAERHAAAVDESDTQPHKSFHKPPLLWSVGVVQRSSEVTAWNGSEATLREGYRRVKASDWISHALYISLRPKGEGLEMERRARDGEQGWRWLSGVRKAVGPKVRVLNVIEGRVLRVE
jgi:hypothetical protein